MDRVITADEILQDIISQAQQIGKDGRIEVVIYKANNVLQNYEIRTFKRRNGKVALDKSNE